MVGPEAAAHLSILNDLASPHHVFLAIDFIYGFLTYPAPDTLET